MVEIDIRANPGTRQRKILRFRKLFLLTAAQVPTNDLPTLMRRPAVTPTRGPANNPAERLRALVAARIKEGRTIRTLAGDAGVGYYQLYNWYTRRARTIPFAIAARVYRAVSGKEVMP